MSSSSSPSPSSQEQTFAELLTAKHRSALTAVHKRYEEMVQKVRLCETRASTPNDWEQIKLALQFCLDVRDQGIRHAQKLYGILGVSDRLGTEGCDLIVCGENESHALGLPLDSTDYNKGRADTEPVLLKVEKDSNFSNPRVICAGNMHSVALTTAGVPFSWGCPDRGVLGRPFTERGPINNSSGECGPAGTLETPHPITGFRSNLGVKEDEQIFQVAVGISHCHYLSLSGQVYSSGTFVDAENNPILVPKAPTIGGSPVSGPVDPNAQSPAVSPAMPVNSAPDLPAPNSLIIPTTHTMDEEHEEELYVTPISFPGRVVSIHSGTSFSAAILEDGTLCTWGESCSSLEPWFIVSTLTLAVGVILDRSRYNR
jgi:hypothetical protein